MVWSQGAFMYPDFYRTAIFPRYKKLWQTLHEAGKTVLFCSDGDFTEFIDDIADAGADGFIFEPMTSLDYAVEKYGKTKVIVSSKVDCRTMTFGRKERHPLRDRRDAETGEGLPRLHLRRRQPPAQQHPARQRAVLHGLSARQLASLKFRRFGRFIRFRTLRTL